MKLYICHKRKSNMEVSRTPSRAKKCLAVSLLSLLSLLTVVYIILTNAVATKGYEIKSLEQQSADLREAYEKLELQAAELQDVSRLNKLEDMGLVAVDKIEYLGTVIVGGVAVR